MSKGLYFDVPGSKPCPSLFFRWSCNHFQGNKEVDLWSNHANPGPSFVWWVCKPVLPRLRNAPLGKDVQRQMHQVHEPTDCVSHFKGHQDLPAQFVWLSLDLARNSPYIDWSESEGAVGPSIQPFIFPVLNDTCTARPENEAKTKARQRPDKSRPEENRQRE